MMAAFEPKENKRYSVPFPALYTAGRAILFCSQQLPSTAFWRMSMSRTSSGNYRKEGRPFPLTNPSKKVCTKASRTTKWAPRLPSQIGSSIIFPGRSLSNLKCAQSILYPGFSTKNGQERQKTGHLPRRASRVSAISKTSKYAPDFPDKTSSSKGPLISAASCLCKSCPASLISPSMQSK